MKCTGPQIIRLLQENFQVNSGRHLYAVVGSYPLLQNFEKNELVHLRLPDQTLMPPAVNLNKSLLDRIGDDELKRLVKNEAKWPQTLTLRLNNELDHLIAQLLNGCRFLALKQIELLFAFHLRMDIFRSQATGQNHIVLLLPGERRGDRITLFAETDQRFHRGLPGQLIADNHLWELENG